MRYAVKIDSSRALFLLLASLLVAGCVREPSPERPSAAPAAAPEKIVTKTGIEMVVVTINSIKDYNTGDSTIESFAKNLGNTWGVGHKKTNDGVVMLVAVRDRKSWISLAGGYVHICSPSTRYRSRMSCSLSSMPKPGRSLSWMCPFWMTGLS